MDASMPKLKKKAQAVLPSAAGHSECLPTYEKNAHAIA